MLSECFFLQKKSRRMILWIIYQAIAIGISVYFSIVLSKYLREILSIFYIVEYQFFVFIVIAVFVVIVNIYLLLCVMSLYTKVKEIELLRTTSVRIET